MLMMNKMAARGGYDHVFVDPGPTDDQKCPICFLIVKNAHQVNCCGKLFCKYCLFRLLKNSNICPLCRENIDKKYFKDTKSDREIQNLQVYCGNKRFGCKWKGRLQEVERHMENCGYKECVCEDCEDKVLQKNMEKHRNEECTMRLTTCTLCGEDGTYRYITQEHPNTCPEVEVDCLNDGCGEVVKRGEMSTHRGLCLKEMVKCPLHTMGCVYEDKREMMGLHIENNLASHLEQTAAKVDAIIKCVPQPCCDVTPVTLKMNKFNELKNTNNGRWLSSGFYTSPGGYKVRLNVCPNNKSMVSVYINLMPGENDENLKFPMLAKFSIELLNQAEDEHHHRWFLDINDDDGRSTLLTRKHKLDVTGRGFPTFIACSHLDDHTNGVKYLVNDAVYFRVQVIKVYSTTKSWLVSTFY